MSNVLRDQAIDHVIAQEGGYVNDPKDAGGETNWGITVRVARKNGYHAPMKDMPRKVAFDLYVAKYWNALELDQVEKLSPTLASELVDTAANMGPGRAAEFLQRALNAFNQQGSLYDDISVDMDVGPSTIAALTQYLTKRGKDGETVMYSALNSLQGSFYINLIERKPSQERFAFGWLLNRVASV